MTFQDLGVTENLNGIHDVQVIAANAGFVEALTHVLSYPTTLD